MTQYLDKVAVMAEIEKLYNGEIDTYTRNILDRLKSNIDTIEVEDEYTDNKVLQMQYDNEGLIRDFREFVRNKIMKDE